MKAIDRKCPICGVIYAADKTRLKHGRDTTCSRRCSYILRGRKAEKKVTRYCAVCGKKIKRWPTKVRRLKTGLSFCCPKCKKAGHHLWPNPKKGTGCSMQIKYLKRKYYKYRLFDKGKGLRVMSCGVSDFVARLLHGSCYYCGSQERLGLDRIDNSKGHTENNTVVCCELCNMTRGDRFSVEEMKEIGSTIHRILLRRGS